LTTSSKEEPNFTDLEVLGAMVYRNGELLTAEPIDKESYTDVAPGYGDIEYSVRVVYGGEEDSYYAMSCPLTEEVTVVRVCDAPKRLYGEEGYNENGDNGVALVWPYTMHGSEWLYYDDNTVVTAVGIGGDPFYWGIMFPAEDLEFYGGTYLTKVSMYDREGHDGNINIYYGGDDAPEILVHSQPYACTGSGQFVEYELTAPLPIDPSMNLWITFNNNNGSFPAAVCASTGDPNGRWISFDGSYWVDVATQAMNYTWMIRAFVTSELKGTVELNNREEVFEHYNVYRGTSSSNMEIVAEPTAGNYFDVVEPGRRYPMTFAIDDEVFNVYFILHGRETIKVKGIGELNVIKFGAKLLEGEVFKGEEDMLIYISDDMNRLPVYFEAPLLVGRGTGRLIGWEGLKHPFSSIIKAEETASRKKK
jgi:hypothetical protein